MAAQDERGWAPFPVQDWQRLPADPLRPPPTGPVLGTAYAPGWSPVDPSWGPPVPARRWWVPLVVLLTLGVLVGAGSWAVLRQPAPSSTALRYLPADGAVRYDRVSLTREPTTTTQLVVTESARLEGTAALLGGDFAFTSWALGQDAADPSGTRLWRTVSTPLDDLTSPLQTTRFYRVRGAVELAGESGPEVAYAYRPALVELPADVAPGASWTSSGSASDTLDYRSALRATAAAGGCLAVRGDITYLSKAGQVGRRLAVGRTWCPGQGQVATESSVADLRTTSRQVPAPVPGPVGTADPGVRWTDPAAWRHTDLDTMSSDPTLGQGPMLGGVLGDRPGVRTASGLVVRALTSPVDLVATTPKTRSSWTSVWRAHPGGTVTSLAALGDVVLVTTSQRALVAYDDKGVRRWQRQLDELAPTPPVRVDDTDAVLVDLGGNVVRFDLATGAVRWQREVGSDVNRAPAIGAGLVVVADRGGAVHALDAATGEERWVEELLATGLLVVPGPPGTDPAAADVVVVQDQVVHALRGDTGRHHWIRHYGGSWTDLALLGGRPLVASKDETVLLGDTGQVVRRLPGYLELTPTLDHVAGWTGDRLDVLDERAAVVASWPTPPTSSTLAARPAVASPDGVLLFGDPGWTFDAWTRGG